MLARFNSLRKFLPLHALLLVALCTWPVRAASWAAWNGTIVGSSAGNVSSWQTVTVGTGAGNIGAWNGLASPGGGGGGPSFVNADNSCQQSFGTSCTSGNLSVTAGNVAFVCVGGDNGTETFSITPSSGAATSLVISSGINPPMQVWEISGYSTSATFTYSVTSSTNSAVNAVFEQFSPGGIAGTRDINSGFTNATGSTLMPSPNWGPSSHTPEIFLNCGMSNTNNVTYSAGNIFGSTPATLPMKGTTPPTSTTKGVAMEYYIANSTIGGYTNQSTLGFTGGMQLYSDVTVSVY